MKILLTGGAGFIGSHTALLLINLGYEVVIYDSFINSSSIVIERLKSIAKRNSANFKLDIIEGDIRDEYCLDKVFKDNIKRQKPIDAVIHFAGLKSVNESLLQPLVYWDVNVSGTKKLLEVMNSNGCFTLVFSSSATVYGLSESFPINEEEKPSPINPYGNTKLAIENMLRDLYSSNLNKWRICVLRYFNPVGAHPSGLIGEDPIGVPNNLFPYITQVAIGRLGSLSVFGADWNTRDGSGIRDYIHIMDLSEGHIAAFDHLLAKESCYEVFNLGSGIGYSVFEIINEFKITTGCKIPYRVVKRRRGDIAKSLADIGKANRILGWFPKRKLSEICMDGWRWQQKNPNGYID